MCSSGGTIGRPSILAGHTISKRSATFDIQRTDLLTADTQYSDQTAKEFRPRGHSNSGAMAIRIPSLRLRSSS